MSKATAISVIVFFSFMIGASLYAGVGMAEHLKKNRDAYNAQLELVMNN